MLYDGSHSITNDRAAMIRFLRAANLTYMCRLILNFLFNMVMPRLRSQDYVCNRDRFYVYNVMVGEKMNLHEVIFYYQMQSFKDKSNPKVKRNLIPFGMLFTQIIRNTGVDVSTMEPSAGASQLKKVTFVKMGLANNL